MKTPDDQMDLDTEYDNLRVANFKIKCLIEDRKYWLPELCEYIEAVERVHRCLKEYHSKSKLKVIQ